MKALSIREMRAALGNLDQLIQAEGELLITRQGKPIARVLPIRGSRPKPSHADLRATMPYLETPSEQLIRADRDER
jgi:antitoxin (DNA-binding transcriptional repressor) of toxin-antitoxin stability system